MRLLLFVSLLLLVTFSLWSPARGQDPGAEVDYTFTYLNAEQLQARLATLQQRCESIMQISSIGKSVEGRDLTLVRMTNDISRADDHDRPKFKYG